MIQQGTGCSRSRAFGGVTVRGAGASYSDAALNEGGAVVATTGHPRILSWDREQGVLEADAGVTLQDAITFCSPRGWSFPVMPGTAQITLCGAQAADVHGMNHPVAGSFSGCVQQIDLATPAQSVARVSPVEQPEVFWATAGGLGLTGAIVRLRIQLTRTSSNWMVTSDTACTGLDDVIETMEERAEQYEHVSPSGRRRGFAGSVWAPGHDAVPIRHPHRRRAGTAHRAAEADGR